MLARLTPRKINDLRKDVLGKAVPASFTLFVATKDDIPAIITLAEKEFGPDTFDHVMYKHYITKGHSLLFGLKQKEKVAAWMMIELNRRQKRIYVTEIVTAKQHRGRGLAKWLWGKVFLLAETLGYKTVTSHVEPSNKKAIALYRKLGMETERRINDYYVSGEDAFYMKREI